MSNQRHHTFFFLSPYGEEENDGRLSSKSVCLFGFYGHFLMTIFAFSFFTPHHRWLLHFCSLIFSCQESDRGVRVRIFGPSGAE